MIHEAVITIVGMSGLEPVPGIEMGSSGPGPDWVLQVARYVDSFQKTTSLSFVFCLIYRLRRSLAHSPNPF